MSNLYMHHKLGAIVFSLLLSTQVSATIITENIFAEVLDGVFAGETGVGSFSYDNELIIGADFETLSSDEFSMELNIFGQTFTHVDDIESELSFFDGLAIELDFQVIGNIPVVGINNFSMFDLLSVPPNGFNTEVSVNTVVPLPVSAWLFASGLLGLMGFTRKNEPNRIK